MQSGILDMAYSVNIFIVYTVSHSKSSSLHSTRQAEHGEQFFNFSLIELPLDLHLTTFELWFCQEQEGILPELFCSSGIV